MTEREKIISLADDAGFSTIDDEYGGIQITDSGNKWITERLEAFYKLAQREALEQAAKLVEPKELYPLDGSYTAYTSGLSKEIRQLIKG